MEFLYAILFLYFILYMMYIIKANFFFLIIMIVTFLYFAIHLFILNPIKNTFTITDDILYNPWGLIILLILALSIPFIRMLLKKLNKAKSELDTLKSNTNSI